MPSGLATDDRTDAIEPTGVHDQRRRERRRRVSPTELYTALEGLLPCAEVHLDWLSSYVSDFPNDPDHTEDAELARRGKEALDLARRLIARKTGNIRRKQRAFSEMHGQSDA